MPETTDRVIDEVVYRDATHLNKKRRPLLQLPGAKEKMLVHPYCTIFHGTVKNPDDLP